MLDIKIIRENPVAFDAALARRGLPERAAEIAVLDAKRRALQTTAQELQAKRNAASAEIGVLKRSGGDASGLMQEVANLKDAMETALQDEAALATQLDEILSTLPNLPAADVPDGKDEQDNVEIRRWGVPRDLSHAKDHVALGEALGLMDFSGGAKLSGARFTVLSGFLARLERALGQFMLDVHTSEFGYTEMSVPILVKAPALYGTGQLPKFAEDLFKTTGEHYLIPTAEVSLTNLVADDILEADTLPRRFTALTPCFRSEAGSAGRDTRGMIRQHQFWKVELVSVTDPGHSQAEHERMVEAAETILKRLGLPFRTMLLCAGDMGFSAQKTYDLEVWLPGQNAYREISSCSNCGDFQARRMKARCRNKGEKDTRLVHTLNGSGLAVGRTLVAILENYQQPDGSIAIPDALRPYLGGMESIKVAA